MQRADTIGVFQIESRAQNGHFARLRPECFYDVVIEVAIIRPGPIQATWSILICTSRRQGEGHLFRRTIKAGPGRTLGVPLFQEQMLRSP